MERLVPLLGYANLLRFCFSLLLRAGKSLPELLPAEALAPVYGDPAMRRLFLWLELSSQVQQRIEENLKRGLPAEAFARSTVEFGNEGCYLSLAEVLHINRLGTVFTD